MAGDGHGQGGKQLGGGGAVLPQFKFLTEKLEVPKHLTAPQRWSPESCRKLTGTLQVTHRVTCSVRCTATHSVHAPCEGQTAAVNA